MRYWQALLLVVVVLVVVGVILFAGTAMAVTTHSVPTIPPGTTP